MYSGEPLRRRTSDRLLAKRAAGHLRTPRAAVALDTTIYESDVAFGVMASPLCVIRVMASPPPHCQRKARERHAVAGSVLHGGTTPSFGHRLALAADLPRFPRLVKRQRVAA